MPRHQSRHSPVTLLQHINRRPLPGMTHADASQCNSPATPEFSKIGAKNASVKPAMCAAWSPNLPHPWPQATTGGSGLARGWKLQGGGGDSGCNTRVARPLPGQAILCCNTSCTSQVKPQSASELRSSDLGRIRPKSPNSAKSCDKSRPNFAEITPTSICPLSLGQFWRSLGKRKSEPKLKSEFGGFGGVGGVWANFGGPSGQLRSESTDVGPTRAEFGPESDQIWRNRPSSKTSRPREDHPSRTRRPFQRKRAQQRTRPPHLQDRLIQREIICIRAKGHLELHGCAVRGPEHEDHDASVAGGPALVQAERAHERNRHDAEEGEQNPHHLSKDERKGDLECPKGMPQRAPPRHLAQSAFRDDARSASPSAPQI